MGNLGRGDIVLDKLEYVEPGEDVDPLDEIRFGDLLFNTRNTLDLVGKVAIWRDELPKAFYNSNLMLLRFENNPFMNYRLNSYDGIKALRRLATGTTSVAAIYTRDLLKLKVRIPTNIQEQQKIATFLTSVDTKIQQLTKKKALLEQYKKGVMQKIFKKEIRFKDEKGRDYPKWERKKLGTIATIVKGKGISKSDIVEDGKLECIRYGELYTHYSQRIDKVISRTNVDERNLQLSETNDVIIPSSGETQIDIATACCVLRSGIALGGDLNIIKSKQNGVFLAYYLTGPLKRAIAKVAQGNSVVHLYPSQLESLRIELPCIEEQNKIANFLGSLDDKIDHVDAQMGEVSRFKKGLLQQMFV